MISHVYAITDPILLPDSQLYKGVQAALEGGVKTIQLRNKEADFSEKLYQAQHLLELCQLHDAQLIINDDIKLAQLSGAHGVHLGQNDCTLLEARERLGDSAIIGITCHAQIQLAQQAASQGASYVAFGRFFQSNTKPLAKKASLNIIDEAKKQLSLPIVAIGGITSDNIQMFIERGAHSVAVCHSLFAAEDIKQQAYLMMSKFQTLNT